MKNPEICSYGIYRTISNTLDITPQSACTARKTITHKKYELVNAIYKDLIAAQVKVIQKYQKKGLI